MVSYFWLLNNSILGNMMKIICHLMKNHHESWWKVIMQHGEKLSWCMMTFHQPFCFYGRPYKSILLDPILFIAWLNYHSILSIFICKFCKKKILKYFLNYILLNLFLFIINSNGQASFLTIMNFFKNSIN